MATDQDLTITDSSASHLGETLPSEPVTAPVFNEPHTSRQASTLTSPADHPVAANDMNDALGPPAPWHDSGSGAHRNGGSSSVADQGHGAGSSGTFNPSQHADRLISSTLDVLPLDDVIDPAPHHDMAAGDHHNAPANDDAKPPHADVSKAGDLSKSADALKTADPLKSDDAANSGADVLATHKAPATPSTGEMVEAGTKAILLATDESPSGIGPHASAADFAPGAAQGHVHSSAHATTAFSPGVIGARDQLASAIATATPEAAAITTLPSAQITDGAPPTLGGDMHALQKHAA
ncbi:hypothetical protein A5906_35025 [Bradyrhizobium sacchari]|nr:hypothetical protein A5906_35025 [Bradyrhizobium sacchari]